uniref:Anaphase-promoting complex subunit 1 middle domain-containing protein n=1 Tax=Eptatretus burgeri TaxID=7764 RepID=A0A8C4Q8K5_EPTBU
MSLSGDKQEIMIAVTDLHEFVPFGREQSSRHLVPPGLELRSLQARVLAYPVDHESSLAGFLHHATLTEEEAWQVRKVVQPNGEPHEEELYSSGKVVIWSHGTYPFSSVFKSFTVDYPVKKVVGVCIVQRDLINVHTSDGEDFIVPVPFQASAQWLVIDGRMLRPVSSFSWGLCAGHGTLPSVRYMAEQNQVVVFTSTEPSLVMTYDREHSVHIIWTLRRERSAVLGPADPSITLPLAVGASGLGVSSSNSSILCSPCPDLPVFCTPFPNKSAPVMSPSGPAFTGTMLSRTRSPSHSNMAASGYVNCRTICMVRRSQSPASSNASYGLRVGSPSPSAIYHRNCNISFNVSANEHEVEAKPVPPELCLEQLWTEKLNTAKLHLFRDLFVHDRCVKLEESNDRSLIIFGAVTCLTAQDAAPLEVWYLFECFLYEMLTIGIAFEPLLVTLDQTCCMILHHREIGSKTINSTMSQKVMDGLFQLWAQLWLWFFKLYSHCNGFTSLLQVLSNGVLLRVTLPEMASCPLVNKCLQALRHVLPLDVALNVQARWYVSRNAPGRPACPSEWTIFVGCLLGLLGWSTEHTPWARMVFVICNRNLILHTAPLIHLSPTEVPCFRRPLPPMSTTPLYTCLPTILLALHLVYEDSKLDTALAGKGHTLGTLLYYLTRFKHSNFLVIDGSFFLRNTSTGPTTGALQAGILPTHPPSIMRWLCQCLHGFPPAPFPYIPRVCKRTRIIILVVNPERLQSESTKNSSFKSKHILIHFLVKQGFTSTDLATLPFGVALPLWETLYRSRPFASINWPQEASELVGREDLAQQAHRGTTSALAGSDEEEEGEDGMAELVRALEPSMLWSTDLRLLEVRRLLQSSRPVRLGVVQVVDISDHEFVEVKEARLLQLCQRTMALPVGRGMFTLFSHHPVPTEPLPIPELNLTGRAPPRNATVDLSTGNMELPADVKYWPLFHNGVAAGLRIAPASCVNSAWIIYNRPQGPEMTEEYAGLLMALGLSGHLCALPTMYIHDFLCKNHNIVSVGLLLGIAAAHLGSMDMSATRLLAVHWPALLPPSNSELEVSHNVQVAAVVGVGLVYQGTAHRHITETLLREIGLPPGPEMQNCTDREAYSLAAGLALGMVCLGHGSNLVGMSDLNVPDQLFQYMVGGQKRRQGGAGKERHKSPSYQIKEGKSINVDVTCPGATMALAMIYLKTNNRSIARWMEAPTTQYLLDFVKPDFLLLRILAKGLILWDEIAPTEEWICSNIPEVTCPSWSRATLQAHCHIVAGACLAMGLRFAGSGNALAVKCLCHNSFSSPNSCNLYVFFTVVLLYYIHCGLCRYSLSTSNSAIAALLCALYPQFPAQSKDNRYHLQALRHLYVLACEPRLLIPVDVDTGVACYAPVAVTYKPLLNLRCWHRPKFINHPVFPRLCCSRSILARDGVIYVKLPAGHLSYTEDPKGYLSLLAQTFTHPRPQFQAVKPEAIEAFTTDPTILPFAKHFCQPANRENGVRL